MKALSLLALSMVFVGCASATDQDVGDPGQTAAEDLSVGTTCEASNMSSSTCAAAKAQILAGTTDPARLTILNRAFAWIAADVPYSQTSYYQTYRQDCSGFVSMAWEEGTSYTTANFEPFASGPSIELGSYSDLLPGDALNKVPREHVFLFGAWADSAHDQMIILEESETGEPALMKTVASSYFDSFKPIRKSDLASETTSSSSSSSDDAGADTGSSSSSSSSGTGCYSNTLGKEMPENACVQSASDNLWYQCDDGSWVDRYTDPTACNGEYPL